MSWLNVESTFQGQLWSQSTCQLLGVLGLLNTISRPETEGPGWYGELITLTGKKLQGAFLPFSSYRYAFRFPGHTGSYTGPGWGDTALYVRNIHQINKSEFDPRLMYNFLFLSCRVRVIDLAYLSKNKSGTENWRARDWESVQALAANLDTWSLFWRCQTICLFPRNPSFSIYKTGIMLCSCQDSWWWNGMIMDIPHVVSGTCSPSTSVISV